jgi:hypothetical protein
MSEEAQNLQNVQDALSLSTELLKHIYSQNEITDELEDAFQRLSEACSDYLAAHYYYHLKK